MNLYTDWGFTQNPFETTALPANALGLELLVGRDDELTRLTRALHNPPRVATLEGPNGVGKTSLANVAAFRCYSNHLHLAKGPLLIPCRAVFQLRPDHDLEAFVEHVLLEAIQTMVEARSDLETLGRWSSEVEKLDQWINRSKNAGWQLTLGPIGAGSHSQQSQSTGFEKSGFRRAAIEALANAFRAGEGIVCIIDNLELLETSERARTVLEHLRDDLFAKPGLRWVLSGATGIVLGVASTARLEGFVHSPIEISGLAIDCAPEIRQSRMRAFSLLPDRSSYLPIRSEDFAHLYQLLQGN